MTTNHPEAILTETVEIAVGKGPTMLAYSARPQGPGLFPGVVVGMELFGLSGHVREVCERLARHGMAVIAPDLFHRSGTGEELAEDAAGRARGFAMLHELTREQALADVLAAVDFLLAAGSGKVGMVGLSVGGHAAYLAASELDLAAVAIAYGGWIPTTEIPMSRPEPTLSRTANLRGRILFMVGEHDQLISPEHRQAIAGALRAAGVRHELVEYPGAAHGFLNDRREAYDDVAADDAWRRIYELLDAELQ